MPKNRVALRIDTRPSIETPPAPTDIEESLVPPAIPSVNEPEDLVLTTFAGRSAVTPTAIIVADWDQPRGAEPQRYAVQYSTSSTFAAGSQTTVVYTASNISSATIENLRTNTTYYVRVAALFRAIQSDWSESASITTPNDLVAPAPVTSLAATFVTTAINNGDLVITWTNPTSDNFKDVVLEIYKSNGGTLLRTINSRTGRYIYTAGLNATDDASSGDPSLYIEATARSYNNVLSTVVAVSPVKARPANVGTPTIDFSGRDLVISWPVATGASDYRLTLNGAAREVRNRTYTYTFDENRTQNTTPDPTITYSIVALDAFDQTSVTATTGTATNAAPAAPTSVTVVGYFSTIAITVVATEPDDFVTYRYRVLRTNPSGTTVTFDSRSNLRSYSINTPATYQVGVRVVDAFGQLSSETLSAAVVVDTLTLADLREDVLYSNVDGTSPSQLKSALADDNDTTGISTSVAVNTWAWWRFERPYLERYETVTFMSNYNNTMSWYIRTSEDGTTWSYFAGPVTSSRILTAVASESAARTAAVAITTLGFTSATRRTDLPDIKQARYVELWTRITSSAAGLHAVRTFYPRRLVQSDDIEAESIRAINIAAGTITGDRLVANTITATQIAANTITAAQIAAGTITATQIAANAITATQIAANAVTSAKIIADAVTADKISVTTLSAISANMGTITAGTITGATIQTATSGARIELTSANGLRSFNSSGVLQTQILTSNGRLTWGGGAAYLDATTGLRLAFPAYGTNPPSGSSSPSAIEWRQANGEAIERIYAWSSGATGVHYLQLENYTDTSAQAQIFLLSDLYPGGTGNTSVRLEARNTSGTEPYIMVMATSSQLPQIYLSGNLVGGISFQNTSSDATKLDYYLEGSWTPNVVGTTTTGTVTYSTRQGKYVRIGKIVWIAVEVEWTGGTGTGGLRIRNLPFTVLNGGAFTSCAVYHNNIALPANAVLQAGFLDNTTDIYFATVVTGGGAAAVLAYDAAGGLWVSGTYEV